MIHAYDEVYLDDAMECLGAAVEYAVLSCNMDGQEFLDLFVASGVADEFGRGNVRFISGMSGIELARHILRTCGMEVSEYIDALHIDYPPEYWCGWILAHYQWHSGKTFATILRITSYVGVKSASASCEQSEKATDGIPFMHPSSTTPIVPE